jgi:hypothetical protein
MTSWPDRLVAAITARWGAPDRRAEFTRPPFTVHVLKYLGSSTGEGVVIYVTATTGPSPSDHLFEFMVGLDEARDDIASALAALAVYAREHAVHSGDTVPADMPLWPGTAMQRFLVMAQREAVVGPFDLDGRHVEYLQAIPMYESEVPAKLRLGAHHFLDELRTQRLGFWQAERMPLPSDIR